ncbi:MAG: DUF5615 family PIN-like protein [Elusimicrobiota bacterium]
MKFIADENVDKPIVDRIRKEGHEVIYVAEVLPNISDDEVIRLVNRESAVLITADKDFGELVFRMGRVVYGVVLVRLSGLPLIEKAEIVLKAIVKYADQLMHSFAVITQDGIRIRKQ